MRPDPGGNGSSNEMLQAKCKNAYLFLRFQRLETAVIFEWRRDRRIFWFLRIKLGIWFC